MALLAVTSTMTRLGPWTKILLEFSVVDTFSEGRINTLGRVIFLQCLQSLDTGLGLIDISKEPGLNSAFLLFEFLLVICNLHYIRYYLFIVANCLEIRTFFEGRI